jgi:hypothetical protein
MHQKQPPASTASSANACDETNEVKSDEDSAAISNADADADTDDCLALGSLLIEAFRLTSAKERVDALVRYLTTTDFIIYPFVYRPIGLPITAS